MTVIKVPKAKWDKIPKDYKGRWTSHVKEAYNGKRTVLSGCISDERGGLLTEGIHFEIVEGGK